MKSIKPAQSPAFLALLILSAGPVAHAQGDAQRGAKLFPQCAACHALEPGRNLTGPSLAALFGRKAGTVPSFLRYSDALKRSGVEWNEATLDAWLKDPAKFTPGNSMTFAGIGNEQARRDLIAYLRAVDSMPVAQRPGLKLPNLKKAKADNIVTAIRHCGDTYFVTTGDGNIEKLWEFNLRFKTDSGDLGPAPGKPVLLAAGMRGDRAAVVFAQPEEISATIERKCQ